MAYDLLFVAVTGAHLLTVFGAQAKRRSCLTDHEAFTSCRTVLKSPENDPNA
jgi:hypothetical protein